MTNTAKILRNSLIVVLATILLASQTPLAQDESGPIVYYTGKSTRRHPDGAVGSVSFHGSFQYALVTAYPKTLEVDAQRFDGEFQWVADDYVNLMGRFVTYNEDSLRYEMNAGLKVYFVNPLSQGRKMNADGVIGGPSFTLSAGMRYPNLSMDETKLVADFVFMVPASQRLSVFAGYRHYEEILDSDVMQGYGGLNFYVAPYFADSAYANPDGPIGKLAIQLTGGGSSKGAFVDLKLIFPISNNITWKLVVRGERVETPYRRSAILGAGLSFYPSN